MWTPWPYQPRCSRGPVGPRSGKHQCLFVLLAIPDDFDGQVLAPRALKGAFIVTDLFRLDANEPHIGVAEFATRMRDHPQLRKCLRSHATQPFYGLNFRTLAAIRI